MSVFFYDIQISMYIWSKICNTDTKSIDRIQYRKLKNRIAKTYVDPVVVVNLKESVRKLNAKVIQDFVYGCTANTHLVNEDLYTR